MNSAEAPLFSAERREEVVRLSLVLLAAMVLEAAPIHAQGMPGGVELWREITSDGDLVIHWRRIDELTAEEWRNLSPSAVAALSKENRIRLDARRKALGIVLVLSPSQNLLPATRDFYERQVVRLEARRHRANAELARIAVSRQLIDQAAIYNGGVIRDLTADSVSHSLGVIEGILLVYGGSIPAATMEKIKAAMSAAKFTAHAMATVSSEPDSERQNQKLLETVNALKNLIPASVVGMDPSELAALKKATDTFPKLISIFRRIAKTPDDKGLWTALAASVDDIIDIAGSLPLVGAPLKATHSAALLLDSGVSLWHLRHDKNDLQEASAGNQTARRYWLARLERIDQLQAVYKSSLAGAKEMDLEDLR